MSNPNSGNRDIWIRGNRRAFGAVLIPSLLCFAAATFLLTPAVSEIHIAWRIVAAIVAGFSLVVIISLLYWIFRPLLAYQNGNLLVYLNPPHVIKVPIDLVEVFFAGQSDSFMPTPISHRTDELSESRNIVIRLAERATDYHERKVKPIFGSWQEGYIVVRGTWTEPIDKETLRFLNKSLVAAHRQQKEELGK
ncbi:MAG: hypothetical protein VW875_15350 [Planctomycetaceae bacterium]|nr:hypothetical protein [Planctomycetaceae bacterium]